MRPYNNVRPGAGMPTQDTRMRGQTVATLPSGRAPSPYGPNIAPYPGAMGGVQKSSPSPSAYPGNPPTPYGPNVAPYPSPGAGGKTFPSPYGPGNPPTPYGPNVAPYPGPRNDDKSFTSPYGPGNPPTPYRRPVAPYPGPQGGADLMRLFGYSEPSRGPAQRTSMQGMAPGRQEYLNWFHSR